jgi:hypothetical protein
LLPGPIARSENGPYLISSCSLGVSMSLVFFRSKLPVAIGIRSTNVQQSSSARRFDKRAQVVSLEKRF